MPSLRYYTTLDRNGTEDEITIHRPNGDYMAFIQFWDEPDTNDAERAALKAQHIVDALNAYDKPLRLPQRKFTRTEEPAEEAAVDMTPIEF